MTLLTSKVYWVFVVLILFFVVMCPTGLFPFGEAPFKYYVVLYIELLLASVIWCFCNIIDIYQGVDDRLYCYSIFGNQVKIPRSREIRSLPVAINIGTDWDFDTGYFSFRNEAGKKRIKFFVLRPANWGVIQQLPID
jgi:hypothetical protein